MLRGFLFLLAGCAALSAMAAEEVDIRELMTAEELAASGLTNLSDSQFRALNRWLSNYQDQSNLEAVRTSAVDEDEIPDTFISTIDGQFNGWNGPTRFPLTNGQVWETRSTRQYSYSALNPEVEFTKTFWGQYRMRVVATGQSVTVRLAD